MQCHQGLPFVCLRNSFCCGLGCNARLLRVFRVGTRESEGFRIPVPVLYSSMILVYTIDYRGVGSVYCHISYARLIQTRTLVPAKASVVDGRIIYPFPIPYSSALQNRSAHKCSCHWIETPSFFFLAATH